MKQWFMLGSAALLVALAGCGSAGGPAAKPQQAAAAPAAGTGSASTAAAGSAAAHAAAGGASAATRSAAAQQAAAPALSPAPGASSAAEPAPAAKGAAPTGAAKPGAARQDAAGDGPAAKQQVAAVAPAASAQALSPTAAAGSSASAPSAAATAPATTAITVSIIGDKQHGVILQATSVPFQEGATVIDVLKQVTKANKIQMEYKGASKYAYVQGIDNLYEFDGGPKSGWVYKVNGTAPSEGAGSYKAAAGDKIEWLYTLDLGKDVGAVQK